MASPIYIWYCSEVYFWRSLASVCWSVLCVPIIMLIFLLLSNVSLIHPVDWLYGSSMSLLSLQVLFSLGVCVACLVMVTWFSLPHFSVVPDVESSHLAFGLGLCRWKRLPLLVVSILASTVSSWSLSRLCGKQFQGLSRLMETDTYERVVINEHHLFLVLSGIASGLAYYTMFFQKKKYYLYFPHVQKYRLPQIRSELSSLVHSSSWQAINVLKYFYAGYFLFGSFPKNWIENSFKMSEDPQAVPINSLRGLLSLNLLWQTFLCSTCVTFAWSLACTLVRIFHTEPMVFPVVSDLDMDREKTLPEALACNYCPLLQHLALLDLQTLASHSLQRRLQLVSLSQPGGHPRTWAAVSGQVLAVVSELCDKVAAENWAIMTKVSMSAGAHVNGEGPSGLRNHDTSIFYRGNNSHGLDQTVADENQMKPQTAASKVVGFVKGLPFISQILAESPEYNSRVLFASCQPQIWAVEGLSEVAAKAYTEDKYGVVQTVLPTIIGALLDLHEALEKHLKLTASVGRKANNSSESPPDILLKQKLFSSNKASIYRIVNTYKDHLSDLRLSLDHVKKLQPFTEYLV